MFKAWIERSAREKDSNIVLTLDLEAVQPSQLMEKSFTLLKATAPYVCAVKINFHLLLPLGLFGGVDKIVDYAHRMDLATIADCKMSDIGNTNRVVAENYFKAGFDALTASSFVGWKEGLEEVFNLSRDKDRGVILIIHLSSKGAEEAFSRPSFDAKTGEYKPLYDIFTEKAIEWKADGAVVGATIPAVIERVAKRLGGQVPIYAPGVMVQGGSISEAVQMGARYIIAGRGITAHSDPAAKANEIRKATRLLQAAKE
ncbi:MAG: orotidine 5'-phosphate decarboxylase [Candidatus Bathyarchaeia archaeon]